MWSSSCITAAHERRDEALNLIDFWRFIAQFPTASAGVQLTKENVRLVLSPAFVELTLSDFSMSSA